MARDLLPYFNASAYGQGAEGVVNYANIGMNYLLVPTFLLVVYALAIFVWSKTNQKMGGGLAFISLVMFIVAIIFQTATAFSQITIFIFFIGLIVGIVLRFIEG